MPQSIVRVAVVQAAPVAFDRDCTLTKVRQLTRDAASRSARLVVFPEAFVSAYPRGMTFGAVVGSRSAEGREWYRRYWESSVDVPGDAVDILADIARESATHLVIGVIERDGGSLYCTALFFAPNGDYLGKHRKLVPTASERLVWGQGDGRGLETVDIGAARVGGLICWENMMPLARFALYERGVELYLAPTADDSEEWHYSIRHIAREARAFVVSSCSFQRASSYPPDVPLADGAELLGRGGSAIVAPDGSYLAGPLWDEEGILYADLDPGVLHAARQRFDPAGHYHRPDVFSLDVTPHS